MNKKLRIIVFVVVLIGVFIASNLGIECFASQEINFRNITVEEGLSQATVETILQDQKGHIWIGTNDGLNKYNGYSCEIFREDKNNKNSIANNYIVELEEDAKGNIWIGTIKGLSKMSSDYKTITNYFQGEEEGNLSHYNIGDILALEDGTILVGTSDGLNVYDEYSDSFERILKNGELSSEDIYSLDEDEEGNIWVGTHDGLNKISRDFLKVQKYYHDESENSIGENSIYKVYCDKDGIVWVGTFNKGASRIDTKTGDIRNFSGETWGLKESPGEHIRNFYRDSNDILWISSSSGLIKYDEKKDKIDLYKKKIYDKRSLIDDTVFTVIEDSGGLLWVGTYGGLSVFDSVSTIHHYKHDPFDESTINDNMIQGIYEDDEGYLWVGTNSKGVNILDNSKRNVASINTSNNKFISADRINDITGYKNLIFLGTSNGLNVINKENGKIKIYKQQEGLPSSNIKTLFIDDKNYLWIGTVEGFSILNIETEEIIDINPVLSKINIGDKYGSAVFQDSEGFYWLGYFLNGGLAKINPETGEIKNYKYNSENPSSIIDNSVRVITEDENGFMWIGTSGGLCKFDKSTETFTNYTTTQGLSNNTIYGILIDDDDNPWVSTNGGISLYHTKEDRFINLTIADGLQSNEFNGEAYLKAQNGEFFFGGINGINSFYPNDINQKDISYKVMFDKFSVNGVTTGEIDNKKFRYDENNIGIQVFLPEYKNNKSTRYYYKLEGADGEWRAMEGSKIMFSNLAPGNYTFRVKAIDSKGRLSEENSLRFRIDTVPWLSFPAILCYIGIIIFLVRRQKIKMKKLDALVDKKTEELRSEMRKNTELFEKVIKLERNKNSYFINLSHELRTPLNVLYSTEQLITKLNSDKGIDKGRLEHYMSIIRRNNRRLLILINNLIDISKIENGKYVIKKKDTDIVYLVEEAALSLKDYVEEKDITFIIDPEIEEKVIKCDDVEIERCIVNLISNAAKFTMNGGEIIVTIEDLGTKVRIMIKDTGIGIPEEFHELIFNRFAQVVDNNSEIKGGSGLGLTITKQIINLHNGEIYVESKCGVGSTFIIELPVE